MSFSAKYWSLVQAKGWVMYRNPKLVDLLEGSDGSELAAAAIYPNSRFTREVDEEFPGKRIGSNNELLLALRSGGGHGARSRGRKGPLTGDIGGRVGGLGIPDRK